MKCDNYFWGYEINLAKKKWKKMTGVFHYNSTIFQLTILKISMDTIDTCSLILIKEDLNYRMPFSKNKLRNNNLFFFQKKIYSRSFYFDSLSKHIPSVGFTFI